MMKQNKTIALLAAMALPLGGCQGVMWANMAVLCVSCGLFFGTLNLGRKPSGTSKPSQGASGLPSTATQSAPPA